MRTQLTITFVLILLLNFSCKKDEHQHAVAEEYYTCPMHPSVRSETPGACPVCGMALVKVEKKSESTSVDHSNMLTLDGEKQMRAHVTIDTVKFTSINAQTTLVGKVAADGNRLTTLTARVKGRIDRLFIRQEGEHIAKGQALYSIYSEQLLADQNDYLLALQQLSKFPEQQSIVNKLISGAQKKLLLWGMTESQIKVLEANQQASALMTYYSMYDGFVDRLLVNEGEYTEIGTPLFQIANFQTVWVETQVYANEIKYLNERTEASIRIETLPLKLFKGKIVFENPVMEEDTKVNLVRFQIDNDKNLIRPGMMARITINHQEKKTLVIPKAALLIGRMTMVWVQVEPGMFESRTVETGIENKKFVEILSGLKEGEQVVTSGGYLLNSEFILKKGAVKAHGH
jgi:Cu(I)/Ag(I) efflux system membrane fusion protein